MADATTHARQVEKVTYEQVTEVRLTLKADEASALVAALRLVGGLHRSSRRELISQVLTALERAGVRPGAEDVCGEVYFQDAP